VEEAAAQGAKLIVFPEVWLPGYPWWLWTESYGVYIERVPEYVNNSPTIDGPEMRTFCQLAKKHNIHIVMGVSEKEGGSLYMGQWTIAPEGLIAHRRKLKPSMVER
jgi:nitrilase